MLKNVSIVAAGATRTGGESGYQQVVDYLSERLLDGTLKAGDRLLPERDLALQLNVSRGILREALRSMAMLGVLEIRQGAGTFVSIPDVSNLGRFLTFMIGMEDTLVDDIMEVRIALERQAIRLACKRYRRSDEERLASTFDRVVATIDDVDLGGRADYEFHAAIVRASHSTGLIKIYEVVSAILRANHIERRRRITLSPRHRAFLIEHHKRLLDSLLSRNVGQSELLLDEHFEIGSELSQAEPHT